MVADGRRHALPHKPAMEDSDTSEERQPRCNAETEAAMDEARAIMGGTQEAEEFDSADDMFEALDE